MIILDLSREYVAMSSDKKIQSVRKENSERLVIEINVECTVMFAKTIGRKTTTLVSATRRMIRAYLTFKQQFDSMSYRCKIV